MSGSSLANRARQLIKMRDECARAAGRAPGSVRLLAVSKGHPVESAMEAVSLGFNLLGENYVQEWEAKRAALSAQNVEWHFIGQLQTNKVKAVVGKVALIHAVDRPSLVEAIVKQAQALGQEQKILMAVNVANEPGKSGIAPEDGLQLVKAWATFPGIKLCGLMIMPPLTENPEESRPHFNRAKQWLEEWRGAAAGHPWNELSMGTSQDFAVAIEEGATIVRVGTVLFGERQ